MIDISVKWIIQTYLGIRSSVIWLLFYPCLRTESNYIYSNKESTLIEPDKIKLTTKGILDNKKKDSIRSKGLILNKKT